MPSPDERREVPRSPAQLEASLRVSLGLLDYAGAGETKNTKEIMLFGTIKDVSARGLSLIVPYFPLDEQFCDQEPKSTLRVAVYLPTGSVELEVQATRCMPLDQTEPWRGFVIGTRIIDVGGRDRKRFDTYVASLTASA